MEYNCDDCNLDCAVVVESLCRNSLIEECKQLQAKSKKLEKAFLGILHNSQWDEKCETKEGLTEAYAYIPRSLIEQALKD